MRGHEVTAKRLEFTGEADVVWLEWQQVVWPMCVRVEDTCFEAMLLDETGQLLEVCGLDETGELLEVCGLDEAGYTRLNEAPPPRVLGRVRFEP